MTAPKSEIGECQELGSSGALIPKLSSQDDSPSPRRFAFSSRARFWSSLTRMWIEVSFRSAFGFRLFMVAIVATKGI